MLKKTLLAAAVASVIAAPAMAKVGDYSYSFYDGNVNNAKETILANETKEQILELVTLSQDVTVPFTELGDIKSGGFLSIELTNGAKFNTLETASWLTEDTGAGNEFGVDVAIQTALAAAVSNDQTKLFKTVTGAGGVKTLDYTIDNNGTRIRIAYEDNPINVGNEDNLLGIDIGADITKTEFTDALTANIDLFPSYAELTSEFTGTNVIDAVTTYLETSNDITSATQNDYDTLVDGTSTADVIDLAGLAGVIFDDATDSEKGVVVGPEAAVGAGTTVALNFSEAGNAIDLSDASGEVKLKVGSYGKSSYTADRKLTDTMFNFKNLLAFGEAAPADEKVDAISMTALVADGFKQTNKGQNPINTTVKLFNQTTNQSLDEDAIQLVLEGDFAGFAKNSDGFLLDSTGSATSMKLNAEGYAVIDGLGTEKLDGFETTNDSIDLSSVLNFAIAADNDTPIEAQEMTLKAMSKETAENFTKAKAELAKFFIIDRDGLTFDTILTGTQSSNTIHIRDINGNLPADGGSIYVTVWEYDQHSGEVSANSTPLAERQPLSVTLPSKGAVTVNPAQIADQLGIEFDEARQARMVFEVETNSGEVAVKKKDASGIDIQTGSQPAGTAQLDFTL